MGAIWRIQPAPRGWTARPLLVCATHGAASRWEACRELVAVVLLAYLQLTSPDHQLRLDRLKSAP